MQNIEPLIFDLVEWVAKAPRTHAEVMNTWRASCPRLTVWEDAVDRGLVVRKHSADGAIVEVTAHGRRYLERRGDQTARRKTKW
jgi:CTP-dependent riboflavin kinase